MDQRQEDGDQFIIIGAKYQRAVNALRESYPDIEIVAPAERRILRPRRKSSKLPQERYVPYFFEYVAINWSDIYGYWQNVLKVDGVWFVLTAPSGVPFVCRRKDLQGMNRPDAEVSWEGVCVEFLKGPLKGISGVYERGKVRVSMFGGDVLVSTSTFNLVKL